MLGRAVMARLQKESDCEVTGLCFSRKKDSLKILDLTCRETLIAFLDEFKPDSIIHTAAIRKPDEFAQNVEKATALNVDATETLASWVAKNPSAHMSYISSDYVFDGKNPPYFPTSEINPVNAYGISKANGEVVCRKAAEERIAILRVPVLYGDVEELSESSVTSVFKEVLSRKKTVLDDWAIRYPTHVANVADVLVQISLRKIAGTHQWSGVEPFTKYDMAILVADILKADTSLFVRSGEPANGSEIRPKDCHLDRSSLEALGVTTKDILLLDAAKKILSTTSR